MKISRLFTKMTFTAIFVFTMLFPWNAFSQENPPEPIKITTEQLTENQKRVSENYQRFDETVLRMSEIMSVTDPDRAALLARVITQSREKMIRMRFDSVVKLLDENALSRVRDNQKELTEDLKFLLTLLESENRGRRIKDMKEQLRDDLKRVNTLIREERSHQSRTESASDVSKLAPEQAEIARKTGELARKMEGNAQDQDSPLNRGKDSEKGDSGKNEKDGKQEPGGKSGENSEKENSDAENKNGENDGKDSGGENAGENGKENSAGEKTDGASSENESENPENSEKSGKSGESSPGQSGGSGKSGENGDDSENEDSPQNKTPQQKLRDAQRRMQEAQKKLEAAEKKGAVEEQEKAIRELEEAKAKLEEILRQLREEEAKRYLALLETRLKKMQQMQRTVYEDTLRLARIAIPERTYDHTVESQRLSRRESDIVLEADKTLLLLREDGSAVALPEVLAQARDDMRRVTDMLGKGDVEDLTQSIETDILAALEEMIAAVQKALKDLDDEEKKQQQAQQSMAEQDPALIDMLTEVKMIRSTQLRINLRTERIGKMISGEHTETPEHLEILKDLARQQERIRQITRDLGTGRNE